MISNHPRLVALLGLFALGFACGTKDKGSGEDECTPGYESCTCIDGACLEGLVCASDRCVDLGDGDGDGEGEGEGDGDGDVQGDVGGDGDGDCDDGTWSDLSSEKCTACRACTLAGPCKTEWEACGPGSECESMLECTEMCDQNCPGDADCRDKCIGTDCGQGEPTACFVLHPQGCLDYFEAFECTVCEVCTNNCDAANVCG